MARLTSKDCSERPGNAAAVSAEAAILRAGLASSEHDQGWLDQRKRRHARRLPAGPARCVRARRGQTATTTAVCAYLLLFSAGVQQHHGPTYCRPDNSK